MEERFPRRTSPGNHRKKMNEMSAIALTCIVLRKYYRDEDIAYAFNLPEDVIREIFVHYRLGARKAVADALHILIYEHRLSDDDIHKVFAGSFVSEEVENCLELAHREEYMQIPDMEDSKLYQKSFKTGYLTVSAYLLRDLRIRTNTTIDEINSLFPMEEKMNKWIRLFDREMHEKGLETKKDGGSVFFENMDLMVPFIGQEVVARLKERIEIAKSTYYLSKLPGSVQSFIVEWVNTEVPELVKQGMSDEEILSRMKEKMVSEGLFSKRILEMDVQPESEDQAVV